jgi:hypothetical protein
LLRASEIKIAFYVTFGEWEEAEKTVDVIKKDFA